MKVWEEKKKKKSVALNSSLGICCTISISDTGDLGSPALQLDQTGATELMPGDGFPSFMA